VSFRGTVAAIIAGVALCAAAVSLNARGADAQGLSSPGLSSKDRSVYETAFAHARSGRWDDAERVAETATDQVLAKVVRWLRLQDDRSGLGFNDYAAFINANPDWPKPETLIRRAEEAMTAGIPDADALAWFERRRPLTADGRIRLAEALYGSGRKDEAERTIRSAWIEADFGPKQELYFLNRYNHLLTLADHVARLDRLLWAGNAREAKRMLRRVSAAQQALAEARMSFRAMGRNVDGVLRRVPAELRANAGLQYERLRWRRIKGRDDEAFEILLSPPKDLVRPEIWWNERTIMARRALVLGRVTDAYRIAADHRLPPQHSAYSDAEWLAGWIAFRQLDDRKEALAHLERVFHSADNATSRSRAAYWAGRAAGALGDETAAAAWYANAGVYGTTYYGQLALEAIGAIELAKRPNANPAVDEQSAAAFEGHEMVRSARALADLGEQRLLRTFIDRMARTKTDPAWLAQTGRLALALGRDELGVRVSRTAASKGVMLLDAGYPVMAVPDGQPERGLTLAVIRQESAFATQAVSSAGASGLMQIMPGTARETARSLGIGYSKHKLTEDTEYNVKLGRGYLSAMIEKFSGSYVLALASYNAGPGAVQRWLRDNGDPRQQGVDVVDWIEMIPYRETRDYVQRVMANLQVYRQRLGETQYVLTLAQDLKR
jgi:soluble lytic murein transglycosylase